MVALLLLKQYMNVRQKGEGTARQVEQVQSSRFHDNRKGNLILENCFREGQLNKDDDYVHRFSPIN